MKEVIEKDEDGKEVRRYKKEVLVKRELRFIDHTDFRLPASMI